MTPKLRRQHLLDLAAQAVAVLAAADEDVRRERVEPGRDRPDVQVVDARHAGYLDDRPSDRVRVDPRGSLLHQDRGRVPEHAPGARDDQDGDRDRDDRVDERPARRDDHERGDEHADRAQQVGHYVPERGLDVEALAARAEEDGRRQGVDRRGRSRRSRASSPPSTSGRSSRRSIASQTIQPLTSTSVSPLTNAARISARWKPKLRLGVDGRRARHDRAEREPDREAVREEVACVREQRETAREQAADDLDDRHREREREHGCEGSPRRVTVVVRVAAAGSPRRARVRRSREEHRRRRPGLRSRLLSP